MAGLLDGPMAKLADNLLRTFGRAAVLKAPERKGDYNPSTLEARWEGVPEETDCFVQFVDFRQTTIPQGLVKVGDRAALVSRLAAGREPVANADRLIENDGTWTILSVDGISSGEAEAAYILHLRR